MKVTKSKLDQIIKEETEFVINNSGKEIIMEDWNDLINNLPEIFAKSFIFSFIATFAVGSLKKDPRTGKRRGLKKQLAGFGEWITDITYPGVVAATRVFNRLFKEPTREEVMKKIYSIPEQERIRFMDHLNEKIPTLRNDIMEAEELTSEIDKTGFNTHDLLFRGASPLEPEFARIPSHIVQLRDRLEQLLQKIQDDIEKAGFGGTDVGLGQVIPPRDETKPEPGYHQ